MLDKFRETAITWDKATRRIYSPITANASDSNGRKLNIQVVNSGQVENLTGATLHLYWETKDKTQHGLDAFTASDISKGEFELFYTTGMLSNVGELYATLVLVDATGKVVSDWFKITVTRGINEDAIESENSFSSLTQALIDISNLEQNYAPRLNNLTAQLQQTMNILGSRLEGEIDDNGRLDRLFQKSIGGTCKIPSGTYYINPKGSHISSNGVVVPSNINIIMEQDTVLKALPDSTGISAVLSIFHAENITITGGKIVGDRYEHVGTSGEHGMGINIYHSVNVTIDSVEIRDCWGDSIYIGGRNFGVHSEVVTSKIHIKNCILDNSRRQGISMTYGNGVIIENCRIININGISPQCGIDIETNSPEYPCKNVMVTGCHFSGSVGGGFVIGNNAENVSIDNCTFFEGNIINITKSINTRVTNCTLMLTGMSIRSSLGVVVSNNLLDNSSVVITSNADITRNTTITGNTFQNNDGDPIRRALQLTGIDNGVYGLNVSGNSFYNYVTETIYFYNAVSDMIFSNNLIKTKNVSRWVLCMKGFDVKVTNNSITVDSEISAELNQLINVTGVRGSFDSNTITVKNINILDAIFTVGRIVGEPVGMVFINNVIHHNADKRAIKFLSVSDTKYKVINNDFSFSSNPFSNSDGHFLYGNILSTTISQ